MISSTISPGATWLGLVLYFVSALSLIRGLIGASIPTGWWIAGLIAAAFTALGSATHRSRAPAT